MSNITRTLIRKSFPKAEINFYTRNAKNEISGTIKYKIMTIYFKTNKTKGFLQVANNACLVDVTNENIIATMNYWLNYNVEKFGKINIVY